MLTDPTTNPTNNPLNTSNFLSGLGTINHQLRLDYNNVFISALILFAVWGGIKLVLMLIEYNLLNK
jgi:hypothetical protein